MRGTPSADFLHAGPSAAQPGSETLQSRRAMLRFGVFLTSVGGAAGLIVRCSLPRCSPAARSLRSASSVPCVRPEGHAGECLPWLCSQRCRRSFFDDPGKVGFVPLLTFRRCRRLRLHRCDARCSMMRALMSLTANLVAARASATEGVTPVAVSTISVSGIGATLYERSEGGFVFATSADSL